MSDILPDSRPRVARNIKRGPNGNMVEIFCAHCGKLYGRAPEECCTFAFVLCQACADKHGHPAHFMVEPDADFWAKVDHEMVGKEVSLVMDQINDPNTLLGKLAKQWQEATRRGKIA